MNILLCFCKNEGDLSRKKEKAPDFFRGFSPFRYKKGVTSVTPSLSFVILSVSFSWSAFDFVWGLTHPHHLPGKSVPPSSVADCMGAAFPMTGDLSCPGTRHSSWYCLGYPWIPCMLLLLESWASPCTLRRLSLICPPILYRLCCIQELLITFSSYQRTVCMKMFPTWKYPFVLH